MEQIELKAQTRTVFGKKTKRLRNSGSIPMALCGPKTDALSLQAPERELHRVLDRAGTNRLISLWVDDAEEARMTLAREVQRDSITHALLHVDFYEVVMTEKLTAEIPIVLVGESPAVTRKIGVLVRSLDSLEVHCLPDQLEESIEVDISVLTERDQAILVRDLDVGADIEVLSNPEEVVVQVLAVREEVIEEILEEVEAEVEVVRPAREAEEKVTRAEQPEAGEEETGEE
ncbi:MAG TPA: 50S ribosomal protein L25 [Anaerolineae bacterium]|jgi:large subunit ribosomal protein L25|nr:50S ribosomal protein L25 [Anaerolineae bacterium]